jgi:hypothetical protein
MIEIVVIIGIVAAAALLMGRYLYRTMTARKNGCNCTADGCGACPYGNLTRETPSGTDERGGCGSVDRAVATKQ